MIPSPLVLLCLALAALRTWQLLARDTVPPLPTLRSWMVGYDGVIFTYGEEKPIIRRERLAEWLQCAWCSGLWWAAAWYAACLLYPRGDHNPACVAAISAAVGLAASALPE